MATARKLQVEIDRTLKRIEEGVAEFDTILDRVNGADTQMQKAKYEEDLKKEIKKLQKFRDQIKAWAADNDIKNKQPLLDARKVIERRMEIFKVVERETKTKAYSKEGLSRDAPMSAEERRRMKSREWVQDLVTAMGDEVDQAEADIESLESGAAPGSITTVLGGAATTGKGGKGKPTAEDVTERLEALIRDHRWHIERLEGLTRMLDNGAVDPDDVDGIKEDLEYYMEQAKGGSDDDYELDTGMYDVFEGLTLGDDDGDDGGSDAGGDDDGDDTGSGTTAAAPAPASAVAVKPAGAAAGGAAAAVGGKTPTAAAAAAAGGAAAPGAKAAAPAPAAATAAAAAKPAAAAAAAPAATAKAAAPAAAPAAAAAGKAASVVSTSAALPLTMPASAGGKPGTPAATPAAAVVAGGKSGAATPAATAPTAAAVVAGVAAKASAPAAAPAAASAAAAAKPGAVAAPAAAGATAAAAAVGKSGPPAGSAVAGAAGAGKTPIAAAGATTAAVTGVGASATAVGSGAASSAAAAGGAAVAASTSALAPGGVGTGKTAAGAAAGGAPGLTPGGGAAASGSGATPGAGAPVSYAAAAGASSAGAAAAGGGGGGVAMGSAAMALASAPASVPPSLTPAEAAAHLAAALAAANVPVPAPSLLENPLQPLPLANQRFNMAALQFSLSHIPEPIDSERPKPYVARNPTTHTHASFPTAPAPALLESPSLFERMNVDTLFFIFYYQQGTYQQYLAAKELKKHSWRFHKKYLAWFKRQEEPRVVTPEYEAGTYVYFDYEMGWIVRQKRDFTFEYAFMEDELA